MLKDETSNLNKTTQNNMVNLAFSKQELDLMRWIFYNKNTKIYIKSNTLFYEFGDTLEFDMKTRNVKFNNKEVHIKNLPLDVEIVIQVVKKLLNDAKRCKDIPLTR